MQILKHFSDCLFYFCSTRADCLINKIKRADKELTAYHADVIRSVTDSESDRIFVFLDEIDYESFL